jgi:hypothetical protein
MYVNTCNNNVVILNGVRDSFRCRQRNKEKKDILRFISYKKMMREKKKIIEEFMDLINFILFQNYKTYLKINLYIFNITCRFL